MATTKTELINTANANEILATNTAAPFDSFSWDSTGTTGSVSLAVRWYVDDVLVETSDAVNITVNAQAGGSYSTEAQAVFTNMDSDPATAYKDAMAGLVDELVTAGIWSMIDELQFPGADTQANSLKGWKGVFNASLSGATYAPKTGVSYDGVDDYTNTGFIPATHGSNYTIESAFVSHYVRSAVHPVDSEANLSGSYPASTSGRLLLAYNANSASGNYQKILARVNDDALVAKSNGTGEFAPNTLYTVYRNGGNTSIYEGSTRLEGTSGTSGGSLSDILYYEGCANITGTPSAHMQATVFLRIFGGGALTLQQITDMNNAVQTFRTAIDAI